MNEFIKIIQSDIFELSEKVVNLENYVNGLEMDMVQHMEEHPKPTEQWTEVRLRALEQKICILEQAIAFKTIF